MVTIKRNMVNPAKEFFDVTIGDYYPSPMRNTYRKLTLLEAQLAVAHHFGIWHVSNDGVDSDCALCRFAAKLAQKKARTTTK